MIHKRGLRPTEREKSFVITKNTDGDATPCGGGHIQRCCLVFVMTCLLSAPLAMTIIDRRAQDRVLQGHRHAKLALVTYEVDDHRNAANSSMIADEGSGIVLTYAKCKYGYSTYPAVLTNAGFVEKTRGFKFDFSHCSHIRNVTVINSECYVRLPGTTLPRHCRVVVANNPTGHPSGQTGTAP